jgi:hypothetical protein
MMARLQILDLLNAVSAVAPAHGEVAVWWYLPPGGSTSTDLMPDTQPAEVVVEPVTGAAPDLESIQARLADRLGGRRVTVRPHGGAAERFHLYRLLSRRA